MGGEAPSLSARLAALQEASAPALAPIQDQNDSCRRSAHGLASSPEWAPAEVVQPSEITEAEGQGALARRHQPERALAIAARRVDAPTKRAGLDF